VAVPDFQWWYLPLLKQLADGQAHRMADLYERLADVAGLSEDDRAQRLPSGAQLTYRNRIGWARSFMNKAGLVASPGRALVQITDRGRKAMASNPDHIDNGYLRQFPEFVEWMRQSNKGSVQTSATVHTEDSETETPLEVLERIYQKLNAELAEELLDRVKQGTSAFFEKVVVDLLLAMGYGGSHEDAGRTVGKSGDGGIDGVINEDRLGLDVIYLQAKRWESSVGRPVVQAFAGSLEGVRAKKGVLITTSGFTSDAREYVKHIEKRIILIDGAQLAEYMIRYNVGVAAEVRYEVKRMDGDYFES
jgi:restriction system protein